MVFKKNTKDSGPPPEGVLLPSGLKILGKVLAALYFGKCLLYFEVLVLSPWLWWRCEAVQIMCCVVFLVLFTFRVTLTQVYRTTSSWPAALSVSLQFTPCRKLETNLCQTRCKTWRKYWRTLRQQGRYCLTKSLLNSPATNATCAGKIKNGNFSSAVTVQ